MNHYHKVKSLIHLKDSRGDIQKNQEGKTTSIIPHSNGLHPVWFHEGSHPVFMKPADLEFETTVLVSGEDALLDAMENGIKNVKIG